MTISLKSSSLLFVHNLSEGELQVSTYGHDYRHINNKILVVLGKENLTVFSGYKNCQKGKSCLNAFSEYMCSLKQLSYLHVLRIK